MPSTADATPATAAHNQSGQAESATDARAIVGQDVLEQAVVEQIESIVDAIAQLSPAQRRTLQRRLQANGLFVPETLLTDQQRLAAAPALGERFLRNRDGEAPAPEQNDAITHATFVRPAASPSSSSPDANVSPRPLQSSSSRPPQKERRAQQAAPSARAADANATDSYHSPISGKIVVGSPSRTTDAVPDPHAMTPLPGQAPERPLILMIERGGYILRWPGEAAQRVRLTFKAHVTEQEAYYDTLIGVLETVVQRLRESQAKPETARLDIRSADRLFVQQMLGEIPCEDIMLQIRRKHARKLLDHFHSWRMVHQS